MVVRTLSLQTYLEKTCGSGCDGLRNLLSPDNSGGESGRQLRIWVEGPRRRMAGDDDALGVTGLLRRV